MKKFGFYFKYAWRSVLRGGQPSLFAILCVAMGVATLVALQSMTISIRATLVGDVQERAGGDIVANVNYNNYYQSSISPKAQQLFDKLKAQGQLTDWTGVNSHSIQITGYFNVPPSVYIIDPAHFPLYGQLKSADKTTGDSNLSRLLAEPNTILISKSIWKANDYKLGQRIEVSSLQDFTKPAENTTSLKIVGVVDPVLPGISFDPGLFVGFGIVSQTTARSFLTEGEVTPTTFYFKTPPAINPQTVIKQLQDFNQNTALSFPFFSQVRTATETLGEGSRNLQPVEDIMLYVGLIAIVIGGLSCVNTMLVMAGRRTGEIATLKALGLKPRQTLLIFTLEVGMLGLLGSLVGIIGGTALGLAMKGIIEGLFDRPLQWGLYPLPIVTGLLVGIVVAALFGFLPAYAAGRVSPGAVLRQGQSGSNNLPRLGNWPTIFIMLALTVIMGLIAGLFVADLPLGLVIAFVTLLISLVLVALMYGVVFLTTRLPTPLAALNLRLALRGLDRQRTRTAATLLVITVSLFFISLLTIVSDSIKTTLKDTFDFNLGFNAGAVNVYSDQDLQLQSTIERDVAGVQKVFISNAIGGAIVSVNARPLDSGPALRDPACGQFINADQPNNQRLKGYVQFSGRSLSQGKSISPNGPQQLLAGRNFGPEDTDAKVLLVSEDEARCYNLKVGDKVVLRLRSNNIGNNPSRTSGPIEVQVIGIVTRGTAGTSFEQGFVMPYQLVNLAGARFSIFFMQIDPPQLKAALVKVQSYLYGNYVFDLTDLINTFTQLVNQVLAFPLLISLLSLFSGSILIANNVALAVLERRTEVGVLKAMGARRGRVLAILLWENGLVGLLGGLMGIGGSWLVGLLLPGLVRASNPKLNLQIDLPPLNLALLIALGVGLAIGATVISAWQSLQEKPLVVLRYE